MWGILIFVIYGLYIDCSGQKIFCWLCRLNRGKWEGGGQPAAVSFKVPIGICLQESAYKTENYGFRSKDLPTVSQKLEFASIQDVGQYIDTWPVPTANGKNSVVVRGSNSNLKWIPVFYSLTGKRCRQLWSRCINWAAYSCLKSNKKTASACISNMTTITRNLLT